ncbi:hypothetical protein LCI18_001982 [Fusarium solani-melongenae]|uniref:Uncharacterized protein n=1 Tax=Fusarium solani subsp. cucurbitae TaxID=2747967 RepID=A0ACD3YPZ2_FUSSC|nr:hypothetical protein LCI18_001982 [Fusarium solani-melongenae]
MDTFVYFTDDWVEALPFGYVWCGDLSSDSNQTQLPQHPATWLSAQTQEDLVAPRELHQHVPTELQHPQQAEAGQGISPQLLSEVDGPQAGMIEENSTAVPEATEPVKRKSRERRQKAEKKSQSQQQGKGKANTRKRCSAAAEIIVRQQNKEAAVRCRRRQCQREADLLSREQSLEDDNRRLVSYCGLLKEEIFHIKEQLLQHSSCDCALIQEYIANEARKSVGKLSSSGSSPCQQEATDSSDSRDGSEDLIHGSPSNTETSTQADALLFQPFYPPFGDQGKTDDVPTESWQGTLIGHGAQFQRCDEVHWVNAGLE